MRPSNQFILNLLKLEVKTVAWPMRRKNELKNNKYCFKLTSLNRFNKSFAS